MIESIDFFRLQSILQTLINDPAIKKKGYDLAKYNFAWQVLLQIASVEGKSDMLATELLQDKVDREWILRTINDVMLALDGKHQATS